MANTNSLNPLPTFNNNKSLYGSRTQASQSSKKISIIEDKTTLEPARTFASSIPTSSNHFNHQRSSSVNNAPSSELSSSQIQKQIQIQKQVLETFDLTQTHGHVYQELDEWKNSMYTRVQSTKDDEMQKISKPYEDLVEFQNQTKKILQDSLIKRLLLMKTNPQLINTEELDEIEQKLDEIKVVLSK